MHKFMNKNKNSQRFFFIDESSVVRKCSKRERERERERENWCNFGEFFLLGETPEEKKQSVSLEKNSWFELSRPLKSETNNIKMMLCLQEGNEDAQDDWIHAGALSYGGPADRQRRVQPGMKGESRA
jgi:hypothetical protein